MIKVVTHVTIHDMVRNVVSMVRLTLMPATRESKWQRNILWNAGRRKLLKELGTILRLDHENNVLERNRAISSMDDAAVDLSESVFSVQADYDKARKLAASFDSYTLRLILDRYGDGNHRGVINWLNCFGVSEEVLLREVLSYRKFLRGDHGEMRRYLMDARFILPYEDFSELVGSERSKAEILIKLSMALYREVFEAFSSLVTGVDSYCRFAGNEIAFVAFDYPNRIDEIARYVGERKIFPSEVNCDHLRDYLNAPSKPLNAGVL